MVVFYAGCFKCLHGGHISLIRKYAELSNVTKIKVIISKGIRNGIDQTMAVKIARRFLNDIPKVVVEASDYPSPILTAYKYVSTAPPGTYTLASSSKGGDMERVKEFVKKHQPGGKYFDILPDKVNIDYCPVDPSPAVYKKRGDKYQYEPISASILREDVLLKNRKNFASNYPNENPIKISKAWKDLIPTVKRI